MNKNQRFQEEIEDIKYNIDKMNSIHDNMRKELGLNPEFTWDIMKNILFHLGYNKNLIKTQNKIRFKIVPDIGEKSFYIWFGTFSSGYIMPSIPTEIIFKKDKNNE